MEIIKNETLVKKNETKVPAEVALKDAEIIGFYFSAHWCGPCREFTPILAKTYNEMKEAGHKFEVVFVSCDEDEPSLFNYMKECHGDWFAVPFGSPAVEKLNEKYSIRGIPMLIIVKKNGTAVPGDGIEDVEAQGSNAYCKWIE